MDVIQSLQVMNTPGPTQTNQPQVRNNANYWQTKYQPNSVPKGSNVSAEISALNEKYKESTILVGTIF